MHLQGTSLAAIEFTPGSEIKEITEFCKKKKLYQKIYCMFVHVILSTELLITNRLHVHVYV